MAEATNRDQDAYRSTVYGQIIVLGSSDYIRQGDDYDGRRAKTFTLMKRPRSNGVVSSEIIPGTTAAASHVVEDASQHSVSACSYVAQYSESSDRDMFQIGRSPRKTNDFIVRDMKPVENRCVGVDGTTNTSNMYNPRMISRFACRIVIERSPPFTTRIYAGGFNERNNIMLGRSAFQWRRSSGTAVGSSYLDGLTTNGVFIMRPKTNFGTTPSQDVWREVSVAGDVYPLRHSRINQSRYDPVRLKML